MGDIEQKISNYNQKKPNDLQALLNTIYSQW